MILTQQADQLLLSEGLPHQPLLPRQWLALIVRQNDEVELARRQRLQPLLILVPNLRHHAGHLSHQLTQNRPYRPAHHTLAQSESQGALPLLGVEGVLAGQSAQLAQQSVQGRGQPFGKGGEQQLVALAVEQLIAELFTQLVEGLADGRGGGAEPLGGAGDALVIEQQVQGDQMATAQSRECDQIHKDSTSEGKRQDKKAPPKRGLRGLALEHRRHGVSHIVDVAAVEARHAHAAGAHQIDGELFAQAIYLLRGEAGVAEHAALVDEVAEIAARHLGAQYLEQLLAHRLDAGAHLGHFIDPHCVQLGLAHHRRGDLATVGGRAGVVATHGGLHLAQHPARLFGILADDRQATAALAVEGEVLGKRVADEEADTGGHHGADGVGILFQSVTEALIGDVHKGDQILLDHQSDDLIPLGAGEIHPGRVVAAGVQQHDALGRQGAQAVDHRIELHAAGGRIVVGVVMYLDAGSLEHRLVVIPGRIADPHLGGREVALEQIGADLECA